MKNVMRYIDRTSSIAFKLDGTPPNPLQLWRVVHQNQKRSLRNTKIADIVQSFGNVFLHNEAAYFYELDRV